MLRKNFNPYLKFITRLQRKKDNYDVATGINYVLLHFQATNAYIYKRL